jgi:hypothetical protein
MPGRSLRHVALAACEDARRAGRVDPRAPPDLDMAAMDRAGKTAHRFARRRPFARKLPEFHRKAHQTSCQHNIPASVKPGPMQVRPAPWNDFILAAGTVKQAARCRVSHFTAAYRPPAFRRFAAIVLAARFLFVIRRINIPATLRTAARQAHGRGRAAKMRQRHYCAVCRRPPSSRGTPAAISLSPDRRERSRRRGRSRSPPAPPVGR